MRLAEQAAPAVVACCRKRRRVKEVITVSSSVYTFSTGQMLIQRPWEIITSIVPFQRIHKTWNFWSRDGPKGDGPNFYSVDLESQLASELPPAWQRLAGYLSKVSCTQIGLDILKVRMVEQVEELEPHLKVKSLREVCVLVNRCIRLHECRVTELPGLLVALSAASGRSELPCGEDTGEVCPARGGLL